MLGKLFGKGKKIKGWGGPVYGFYAEKGTHRVVQKSIDKKEIRKYRKHYKTQGYDIFDMSF